MTHVQEVFRYIFRWLSEPDSYAKRRERRCRQNEAFMAMMEKRIAREQQLGAFRYYETAGSRLRSSIRKLTRQ